MTDPLFSSLTDEQRVLLDALIAEYPKQGKWDHDLVMWSYAKGFEAGQHHGKLPSEEDPK